jgi:hypothetical protein
MNAQSLSSGFSKNKIEEACDVFDMLLSSPLTMAKRESAATYLRGLLLEKFGDSYVKKASGKAKRMKLNLPETTIRDLLDERPRGRGPVLNTLKAMAAVLDIDDLEFVSHWLDRPIEAEGFSESKLAALYRTYSSLEEGKQERMDHFIDMMIREMDRED